MATYSFENDEKYLVLKDKFVTENGREPNDLDKMVFSNQLVSELLHRLVSILKQKIVNEAPF